MVLIATMASVAPHRRPNDSKDTQPYAVSPSEVTRRLACTFAARSGCSIPPLPLTSCLSTLLEASTAVEDAGAYAFAPTPDVPQWPPLISLANTLCAQARERSGEAGALAGLARVAVDALATAVFEAATGGAVQVIEVPREQIARSFAAFAHEDRLHELALCYFGHYFQHLFWHLLDETILAADQTLPRYASADHSQLRDAVGYYCKQSAMGQLAEPCKRLFAGPAAAHTCASAASLRRVQALTEFGLQSLLK